MLILFLGIHILCQKIKEIQQKELISDYEYIFLIIKY